MPDTPADPHAFYAPYRPTLWQRLGFGTAHAPRDDDIGADWATEGWFIVESRIKFTWAERIRVLISGQIHVQTACKTDVPIGRSASVGCCSVLPPGAR